MDASTSTIGSVNTSSSFEFINDLDEFLGCGSDGADFALVTGTVDYASNDGMEVAGSLGICYQELGSSTVVNVGSVLPDFVEPASSYFAQSVSAIIGKVPCDLYTVGLCVASETSNALHGDTLVTVLVGHPTSGGTPAAVKAKASTSQRAH